MGTKEMIKNVMQEKLRHLSKEELIDIISDLSAVYIVGKAFCLASVLSPSNTGAIRTDLVDMINSTVTNLSNRKPDGKFVCQVNYSLFKRKD